MFNTRLGNYIYNSLYLLCGLSLIFSYAMYVVQGCTWDNSENSFREGVVLLMAVIPTIVLPLILYIQSVERTEQWISELMFIKKIENIQPRNASYLTNMCMQALVSLYFLVSLLTFMIFIPFFVLKNLPFCA